MKEALPGQVIVIEDHQQAYYAWKEKAFRDLPLIHIDAHVDFEFQEIKSPRQIIEEAKSVKEIKSQLEKLVLFERLELKKNKLIRLGNYIYPAMQEGIIKDFYWVIPGDKKEFRHSLQKIESIVKRLKRNDPKPCKLYRIKDSSVQTLLYGKNFVICCLQALPKFRRKVLLDIDTDFLVIDSLRNARNTDNVSRRKVWIEPKDLVRIIHSKIKKAFITIAYSVNGGYTPLKFKYIGNELAARLKGKPPARTPASIAFDLFNDYWQKNELTKARHYYWKSVALDATYRVRDNNYGPLYLSKKRFKDAEKEFKKILTVDPYNIEALCGMGEVSLNRQRYACAKGYFKNALNISSKHLQAILGMGKVKFKLREYRGAQYYLYKYQRLQPMQPYSHYLLARIYRKQRKFQRAQYEYEAAYRLGMRKKRLGQI